MLAKRIITQQKRKKVINLGKTEKPHWFQVSASKLLGDD